MSAPFDRVILGDVVTTDTILRRGYIAVRGETIAAIGQGEPPPAAETVDHSGRLILPGLVDGHMHTSSALGWPGIEGATRSAAAGGVTTCCDMPYDVPLPVTDAGKLADKIGWVTRTAHVDMALYGTITKQGGVGAIPELAAAGISAFKLSTYEYDAVRFPRIDHQTMRDAFAAIARTGLPVAIHNEDQELVEQLTAEARAAGRTDPIMHARTRPPRRCASRPRSPANRARRRCAYAHRPGRAGSAGRNDRPFPPPAAARPGRSRRWFPRAPPHSRAAGWCRW